jgi:hypothetical protein
MSRGRCCGVGCLGVVAALVLTFIVGYFVTGRYQPVTTPPPPLPNPNALNDYITASIMFERNGGDMPMYDASGQPSLLNQSSVVTANQPALARLRQGFGKQCGIPFEPSINAQFDYLAKMRSMARLLSAEADVFDAGSNPGRAVSSGVDAIRLGTDIQSGGTLIHGLTGTAIQAIGHSAALPRVSKLSKKQCEDEINRLQGIVLRAPAAQEIMGNERRWLIQSLARMDPKDYWKSLRPDPNEPQGGSGAVASLFWHFARDKTIRDVEKYMSAAVADAGKPAADRKPIPEPGGLAGIMVPVYTQATDKFNTMSLRNRLLLLEIAIRRYRLMHGDLPKSLSDLGLNPKALLDPDSGKPIIYRKTATDYLLYGVGPDGKDDGGVPANEGVSPQLGDIGIRMFNLMKRGDKPSKGYRLVPHMLSPKLPPGSPPLKD